MVCNGHGILKIMKFYNTIITLLIAVVCVVTSCTDEFISSVDDKQNRVIDEPKDSINETREYECPIDIVIEVEPIEEVEIVFDI